MAGHVLGRAAAEAVAGFLKGHLPWEEDGWQDYASTAFQIGCEALSTLGHARLTEWGAAPVAHPALPAVLPRWDDIAVAVLWLAHQRGDLAWRQMDGSVRPDRAGGWVIHRVDPPPLPPPNISAGRGTGPARVTPQVVAVLEGLGLVAQGAWTDAAETVLWRDQPLEWGMQVTDDPRFVAAVNHAVTTLPKAIKDQIAALVRITDADVAAAVAQSAASVASMRARYGPKARIAGLLTPDSARRSLIFLRQGDLGWLFFRNWRLADGWLAPDDPTPRLEIFHDRLAIQMRQAVLARLYPESPVAG